MCGTGLCLLAAALAGCSSSSSLNPVNWWHGLQGGRIAEERPAPPGADAPYPNLATVPPRPEPPDRDAMKRLTESLIGDRSNARYTAEAAPLADPSSPAASPDLFGKGTLPPPPAGPAPGSQALSASLPAASAPPQPAVPPAPAAPPSPAPLRPVQSQPLAPPAAAEPIPPPAGTEPMPAALAPVASTEALPPLPAAPPARAAAAPPPPPPAPQSAPASPAAQGGLTLGFAPGSSQLSPTAADEVKRFLSTRVGQPISVTGHGDAVSADPGTQTAAVSLALTRAQAVVNALTAAGVPRTAISVGAEAAGRGASLRLLQ